MLDLEFYKFSWYYILVGTVNLMYLGILYIFMLTIKLGNQIFI